MSTLSDIKFDGTSFPDVDHIVLLLYESSISILIIGADQLTFIHTFNSIPDCQQYIKENNEKLFTLFAYSENMISWLLNENNLPENLTEIILFCALNEDKYYLQRWIRRYSEKIKIVTFAQLECELLFFGIKYIQDLIVLFKNDITILNSLEDKYQQLCSNLISYFTKTINNTDNKYEKIE